MKISNCQKEKKEKMFFVKDAFVEQDTVLFTPLEWLEYSSTRSEGLAVDFSHAIERT
jgi:hypothetical protein